MPGAMTPEQIAFLESQRIARLATVDEHGHPHALPVCYAIVGGCIYTPIDEKPKRAGATLRRVRNILANPYVCLVADEYDEDWTRLAWLQVRGTASIELAPEERSAAIAALRRRYAQYAAMDLEARALIRISPDKVVEWRWKEAALTPGPSPVSTGEGSLH